MKKYLPIILFIVGLGVVTAVFFIFKGKGDVDDEDTSALIEVSLEDRPIAKLTPSEDGHWLKLIIEKLEVEAASLDYELLYKLPDGRTQGVPGTIKLTGQKDIERDLLLGSESSGKFRYDEGVENGTLTLRYRNEKGKLLARFTTEFALLSGTKTLASVDEKFEAKLSKSSGDFFVVMETFGIPDEISASIEAGPYGVFNSSGDDLAGTVKMSGSEFRWDGTKWTSSFSYATGIFIGTSE